MAAGLDRSRHKLEIDEVVEHRDQPADEGDRNGISPHVTIRTEARHRKDHDQRKHERALVPTEIARKLPHDFADEKRAEGRDQGDDPRAEKRRPCSVR